LYELIARRFIASFSEDEIRETYSLKIKCGAYYFRASATRVRSPGWSAIYNLERDTNAEGLPALDEGAEVVFDTVDAKEQFDPPPSRYNQSTLLEKMEYDDIGTKATRAEVISTLIRRGYMSGSNLELSNLGFAVVEAMSRYSPSILSPEMTRSIEAKLDGLETGALDPCSVAVDGVEQLMSCLRLLEINTSEVGLTIRLANTPSIKSRPSLGTCPICHEGQLVVIHSRKSGKRFVGCSNYKAGCRASAPLPQRGAIRATTYLCQACGWPVVLVFLAYGRQPWRLCVNPACPAKRTSAYSATTRGPTG
jgi:DNA topoisomerase-1